VADGGTDSSSLPSIWRGELEVWLVDAVRLGASPGTVHRLGHDAILAFPERASYAHRLSLPESLRCLAHAWPEMALIRYRLWGIEPTRLDPGGGLSDEVARAVGVVAAQIRGEARRLGRGRRVSGGGAA